MTTPSMNERALNRALLARQLLLERATLPAHDAIAHLIGLQSQAPHPPYTGLWSRLAEFDPDTVSHGLTDRSLVRASTLRGTVHLMTASDAASIRPHLQPTYDRLLRANQAFPKLDGIDFEELAAFGARQLTERPRSLNELRPALLEQWPDRDPAALALAVSDLVPLVQLPPRGLWRTTGKPVLAPLESWLGPTGATEPVEAFVRRYLAAFGPANAADMQTWSGLMGLKPVFERMRPELIAFHDGSREIYDLPEAPRPDPDTPAPVRFIAEWDNLLIGHQRRARIISEANRKRIATPNGMVPGTILIDGFVQGAWKIEKRAGDATLAITLFRSIDDADRADLEQEGEKLLAFLSSPETTRHLSVAVAP